jgi:hypothetical protein
VFSGEASFKDVSFLFFLFLLFSLFFLISPQNGREFHGRTSSTGLEPQPPHGYATVCVTSIKVLIVLLTSKCIFALLEKFKQKYEWISNVQENSLGLCYFP